jgi:hypothetical protein
MTFAGHAFMQSPQSMQSSGYVAILSPTYSMAFLGHTDEQPTHLMHPSWSIIIICLHLAISFSNSFKNISHHQVLKHFED